MYLPTGAEVSSEIMDLFYAYFNACKVGLIN